MYLGYFQIPKRKNFKTSKDKPGYILSKDVKNIMTLPTNGWTQDQEYKVTGITSDSGNLYLDSWPNYRNSGTTAILFFPFDFGIGQ